MIQTKFYILFIFLIFSLSMIGIAIAESENEEIESFHSGNTEYNNGNYENAISHYKKTLELNPNNLDALTNIGNSFVSQNKIYEGLIYYQRVLDIDPQNFFVLENISRITEFFPYKNFDGFVEIVIRNSDNQLVGYLKTDTLIIFDHPEVFKFIKQQALPKKILINGTTTDVLQMSNVNSFSIDAIRSTTGFASTVIPTTFLIYVPTFQYAISSGDQVFLYATFL